VWSEAAFASAQAAYERPPAEMDEGMVECNECDLCEDCQIAGQKCPDCVDDTSVCRKCQGTREIYAEDHPDFCSACGFVGNCPECDPDRYSKEEY
jgi:hypothetical protein